MMLHLPTFLLFFFNDTATTEIYTLSLHDALPILPFHRSTFTKKSLNYLLNKHGFEMTYSKTKSDRKSTRLNSSHQIISYAVFCLKKKKKINKIINRQKLRTRIRTHLTYTNLILIS